MSFESQRFLSISCPAYIFNAFQVPKVGSNRIFLAINPSPAGLFPSSLSNQMRPTGQAMVQSNIRRMGNNSLMSSNARAPAASASNKPAAAAPNASDQVSILVRPSNGSTSKPVLLNVPRKVAVKVRIIKSSKMSLLYLSQFDLSGQSKCLSKKYV